MSTTPPPINTATGRQFLQPYLNSPSALSLTNRLINNEWRHIPTMSEMISADFSPRDLSEAFALARTEIVRLRSHLSGVNPCVADVALKWCYYDQGDAFHDLSWYPIGVIRALVWDIWRDILALKYGVEGWEIGVPVTIPWPGRQYTRNRFAEEVDPAFAGDFSRLENMVVPGRGRSDLAFRNGGWLERVKPFGDAQPGAYPPPVDRGDDVGGEDT